ncbi:MAG: DUF1259 domain-containing protein [Methanotrichaceae archaeon]|nr:DUF1259 domain-containing protein [Methanotrichaceae archaeon]
MLDAAIGVNGKYNGNVYQFDVLRKERITEEGMELTPSLDVATEINFQPLGGGNAAVAGEFVLMAKELNPVIRALRENNINVTAIHNHMIYEEPRLIFLHIWATGGQNKLAIGLKEALDKTNSSR